MTRRRWWPGWLPIVVITLLAAGLRFWALDRPGIWGDEAATYGRVNGTQGGLLDRLKFDGFMPLHYQLYFVLAKVHALTPGWMRLWPAVAGTAMVPAVYFLARQLVTRRVALLAALLTAVSAYQLYYSRDAKMYAGVWLFTTLSMGCFFWWLRAPKRVRGVAAPVPVPGFFASTMGRASGQDGAGEGVGLAEREALVPLRDALETAGPRATLRWLLWVLTSLAAVGIHAPALLAIATQPVMFLVLRGKSWGRAAALVVGFTVIAATPPVYYSLYNEWVEDAEKNWNSSMLQWVERYNEGRDLPQLIRFTATAYATAWEWADKPGIVADVDPVVFRRMKVASVGIGVALAAGLLPWGRVGRWAWAGRRWMRMGRRAGPKEQLLTGEARVTRCADVGLREGGRPGATGLLMVLGVWMVVPSYLIYVLSVDAPVAPWWAFGAWRAAGFSVAGFGQGFHTGTGLAALLGTLAVVGLALSLRRKREALCVALGALVIFGVCCGVYEAILFKRFHPNALHGWELSRRPWQHVDFTAWKTIQPGKMLWMPRYLGVMFPALAIGAALLLSRLPLGVRELAVVGFVVVNLANFGAKVQLDPEPPIERVVADLWADTHGAEDAQRPVVFLIAGRSSGYEPGTGNLNGPVGRYYVSVRAGEPVDPGQFKIGFNFFDRRITQRSNLRPAAVKAELAKRPGATEVICWASGEPQKLAADPMGASLGVGWGLAEMTSYQAYDHWTWERLNGFRRFRYVRESVDARGAASAPATRPVPRQR